MRGYVIVVAAVGVKIVSTLHINSKRQVSRSLARDSVSARKREEKRCEKIAGFVEQCLVQMCRRHVITSTAKPAKRSRMSEIFKTNSKYVHLRWFNKIFEVR